MNKKCVVFMMFCTLVILSGCGAVRTSDYLTNKSVVFYPQTLLTQEDDEAVRAKSMQALMDSFAAYRWEIHGLDRDNGIIIAEACRRGQHCAEVEATVKNDGSVQIIRTPGQTLSRNEGILLQRWLGRLKKAYNMKMNPKPNAKKEEAEKAS